MRDKYLDFIAPILDKQTDIQLGGSLGKSLLGIYDKQPTDIDLFYSKQSTKKSIIKTITNLYQCSYTYNGSRLYNKNKQLTVNIGKERLQWKVVETFFYDVKYNGDTYLVNPTHISKLYQPEFYSWKQYQIPVLLGFNLPDVYTGYEEYLDFENTKTLL